MEEQWRISNEREIIMEEQWRINNEEVLKEE